jgi:hypothetical protein
MSASGAIQIGSDINDQTVTGGCFTDTRQMSTMLLAKRALNATEIGILSSVRTFLNFSTDHNRVIFSAIK